MSECFLCHGSVGKEKAITNILASFRSNLAGHGNSDNETFPGAEKNMNMPGITKLHTWLPFWNTLCLVTSSGTIALAEAALKKGKRAALKAGWS